MVMGEAENVGFVFLTGSCLTFFFLQQTVSRRSFGLWEILFAMFGKTFLSGIQRLNWSKLFGFLSFKHKMDRKFSGVT